MRGMGKVRWKVLTPVIQFLILERRNFAREWNLGELRVRKTELFGVKRGGLVPFLN